MKKSAILIAGTLSLAALSAFAQPAMSTLR